MITGFINGKQIIRVTNVEDAKTVVNALESAGTSFSSRWGHISLKNVILNVEHFGYRNIYVNDDDEIHYCDDSYKQIYLNDYKEVSINKFKGKSVKLKTEMDLINYIRDNKIIVIVETKIKFDILRELYIRNVHEGYIYDNSYPSQYKRIYVRLFLLENGFYETGWDSRDGYYKKDGAIFMKFEDVYDMLE